jgi:hypothetical protein
MRSTFFGVNCFDIRGSDPSVCSGLKSGKSQFPNCPDASAPALRLSNIWYLRKDFDFENPGQWSPRRGLETTPILTRLASVEEIGTFCGESCSRRS